MHCAAKPVGQWQTIYEEFSANTTVKLAFTTDVINVMVS